MVVPPALVVGAGKPLTPAVVQLAVWQLRLLLRLLRLVVRVPLFDRPLEALFGPHLLVRGLLGLVMRPVLVVMVGQRLPLSRDLLK